MSNVSLEIGGRQYSVASADGEEEHVAMLGRRIDEKLRAMGGAAGQSESRMLLFAALLLADEIHEMTVRGGAPAPPDNGPALARIADGIDAAARRIENLAASLEAAAR
ncbi:cell division protein ZapA [Novosphingobium sp. Gsoil 351]|uniref:cell division protein ZapA n=1 Tax=Novosphingobium sp. Gsoil 351 TaxID=2675225 RepID=UPI0012B4EADA|nr:cell division protein ZapA [Novosphingobium sp. Gsoil 351]QGN53429.1 cell division protein ZapA [Novosphingobium sp. Gsoil 351]